MLIQGFQPQINNKLVKTNLSTQAPTFVGTKFNTLKSDQVCFTSTAPGNADKKAALESKLAVAAADITKLDSIYNTVWNLHPSVVYEGIDKFNEHENVQIVGLKDKLVNLVDLIAPSLQVEGVDLANVLKVMIKEKFQPQLSTRTSYEEPKESTSPGYILRTGDQKLDFVMNCWKTLSDFYKLNSKLNDSKFYANTNVEELQRLNEDDLSKLNTQSFLKYSLEETSRKLYEYNSAFVKTNKNALELLTKIDADIKQYESNTNPNEKEQLYYNSLVKIKPLLETYSKEFTKATEIHTDLHTNLKSAYNSCFNFTEADKESKPFHYNFWSLSDK